MWAATAALGTSFLISHPLLIIPCTTSSHTALSSAVEVPMEFSEWTKENSTMVPLRGNGYCNSLYRVSNTDILKVYSDLAKARMEVSGLPIGSIDQKIGKLGFGPQIWASSKQGIIMECLDFPCLTEADLHAESATEVLQAVAESLSRFHSFPIPTQTPNMLWKSLEVLVERIPNARDQAYYAQQVERQRSTLEDLELPTVMGHGDCKPANIIYNLELTKAQFIDLETAGRHYRGFDLAKLFRTNHPTRWSEQNRQELFESYIEQVGKGDADDGLTLTTLSLLQAESKLLLPMTWLEAAVFFEANGDSPDLANDRRQNYQKSCRNFADHIKLYQKAKR